MLLVGLGAKNAILIVEVVSATRASDMSVAEAVVAAGQQRLRPILMTSIAFIAGVITLILSGGAGAANRQAMAVAVAGGMFGGAIPGLFVLPIMCMSIE